MSKLSFRLLVSILGISLLATFMFLIPREGSENAITRNASDVLSSNGENVVGVEGQELDRGSVIIEPLEEDKEYVFDINEFQVVFGAELSLSLRQTITRDLNYLLGGKPYVLETQANSVFRADEISNSNLTPGFRINYLSDGYSRFIRPLAISDNDQQSILPMLEVLFNGDAPSLFINQALINVYEEQLELLNQYENSLDDLNLFVERINALSDENVSIELAEDVLFDNSESSAIENLNISDVEGLLTPIQSSGYKDASILNVVTSMEELGDESIQALNIPRESLIATIYAQDVNQSNTENGIVNLSLIYVDRRWKIFFPQY